MDNEFRGVRSVKVKTEDLLKILVENRDKHSQLYKDAMEGYFVETKAKLEKKLKDIEDKKSFSSFKVNVPRDHTEDYNRIIDMLTMSQDTELVIQSNEFNQYVRDEWISHEEKSMMRAMALSSSNSAAYL